MATTKWTQTFSHPIMASTVWPAPYLWPAPYGWKYGKLRLVVTGSHVWRVAASCVSIRLYDAPGCWSHSQQSHPHWPLACVHAAGGGDGRGQQKTRESPETLPLHPSRSWARNPQRRTRTNLIDSSPSMAWAYVFLPHHTATGIASVSTPRRPAFFFLTHTLPPWLVCIMHGCSTPWAQCKLDVV